MPSINIKKLQNGIVISESPYYPNIILASTLDSQSPESIYPIEHISESLGQIQYKYRNTGIDVYTDIVSIPVFYFIYDTENYYHFIYDTIPYLLNYKELQKSIPNIKLLMQYPPSKLTFYPYVIEMLVLMGINVSTDVTILNHNAIYRNIYISSLYRDLPNPEIYQIYSNIAKNIPPHDSILPKKIYISRRTKVRQASNNIGTDYTTRRYLVCESDLVALLKRHGYVEIFTELMTMTEKIQLFSQATDIIGCIGGGLVNLLFAPAQTRVTVIVSPTFLDINRRFQYCMNHTDIKYFMETHHIDKGLWKRYMRVKYKGQMAEICDIIDNDIITIKYGGSVSGFNNTTTYDIINVNKKECIPLDKGLNSPYDMILSEFQKFTLINSS